MQWSDSPEFWSRMRSYAYKYSGRSLDALDEVLQLENGKMEELAERSAVPDDGIMLRLEQFTGKTAEEMILGNMSSEASVEVTRKIFVLKAAEFVREYTPLAGVLGRLRIDVPRDDSRTYVGVRMWDEAMSGAHIFPGDILIVRRQLIADDGDIVVAKVDGDTIVRRYHQQLGVLWLEAEGPISGGPAYCCDSMDRTDRKIHIFGKVISAVRLMSDDMLEK